MSTHNKDKDFSSLVWSKLEKLSGGWSVIYNSIVSPLLALACTAAILWLQLNFVTKSDFLKEKEQQQKEFKEYKELVYNRIDTLQREINEKLDKLLNGESGKQKDFEHLFQLYSNQNQQVDKLQDRIRVLEIDLAKSKQ